MKQHNLKNLITGDPTFFDSFAFIFRRLPSCHSTLQLSSLTCCYMSAFLSMIFRAYQYLSQEMCLLLPSSHCRWRMCFTNWILGSLYTLSVTKSHRFPQLFFLLFNNSLLSPHVPFCLLSRNNQHFDFFSVFLFPWWREYYRLFLWRTGFEQYKLQIDFLIFEHIFLPWILCIQVKYILKPGD